MKSVLVRECPEFERDALNGGLKRVKPEEPITPEIEGDGRSSWWWVCGECHAMLEYKAKECKHCGRRAMWNV